MATSEQQRFEEINDIPVIPPTSTKNNRAFWEDAQEHNFHVATSTNPTGTPEIWRDIDADFNKIGGYPEFRADVNDAKLRWGSGIEYHDPNLEINDQFLTSLEQAFYANRGQIPLTWYAQWEEEDLRMLGFDEDGIAVTQAIKNVADWSAINQSADDFEVEQEEWRLRTIMNSFGLGEEKARLEISKVDQINAEITQQVDHLISGGPAEVAKWLSYQDPRGKLMTAQEITDMWLTPASDPETGYEFMDAAIREVLDRDVRPELEKDLLSTTNDRRYIGNTPIPYYSDFGGGVSSRTILEGGDTSAAGVMEGFIGDAFGLVGLGLNGVFNGFAWGVNESGALIFEGLFNDAEGSFGRRSRGFAEQWNAAAEDAFPSATGRDEKSALEASLRAQLGQDERFKMQGFAIGPLRDQWDIMQDMSRETHDMWMQAAGGDPELAFGLWAEDTTFHSEWTEVLRKQVEVYDAEVEEVLRDMQEEDFLLSTSMLDLLSVWGEGVETLGVAATLFGKALFEWAPWIDGEGFNSFAKRVLETDTVAEAMGVQGTLVGLSLDLLIPALVDPTTWIFGARLAGRGRAGATNPKAAYRASRSPVSRALHKQNIAVRQGDAPFSAYAVMNEQYGATRMAGPMWDAFGGFNNPIMPGARKYLDEAGGEKVHTTRADTVNRMIPDRGKTANRQALVRGAERLDNAGGVTLDMVPEITYNPKTQRAQVTKNEDIIAALQARGHDAVPTRIRVDESFGYERAAPSAEALQQKLAPDGTMTLAELEELAQLDFAHSKAKFADREKIRGMQDHINEVGVDKAMKTFEDGGKTPLEVTFMPDDGRLVLADGHHRIVALRHHGVRDVPMQVKITTPDVKEVPLWRKHLDKTDEAFSDITRKPVIREDLFDEIIDPDLTPVPEWTAPKDVPTNGIMSPAQIMDNPSLFGDVDFDHIANLEMKHILRGGDPAGGRRTVLSVHTGYAFRRMLDELGVGSWVDRHFVPVNTMINIDFTNANAVSNISEIGARVWGSVKDLDGFNFHMERVHKFYGERHAWNVRANRLNAEAEMIYGAIEGLRNSVQDARALRQMPSGTEAEIAARAAVRSNIISVQKVINEESVKLRAVLKEQEQVAANLNHYGDLHKVLDDMYTDFNKKHIATNPAFADLVDDSGMVPWEAINGGRRSMTDQIARIQAKLAEGVSVDDAIRGEVGYVPARLQRIINESHPAFNHGDQSFFDSVMHNLHTPSKYVQPMNPIELMAAPTASRGMMSELIKREGVQTMRQGLHQAHQWWMIDKVMTPRTGIVVALDEQMRIWQTGGRSSWFDWMEDRAIFQANRAGAIRGNSRLSNRWNRRLQALEEYPNWYRQADRAFLEMHGVGIDAIEFKRGLRTPGANAEFYNAANRVAGQQLNEAYVQAYFKGPEAFKEWFETQTQAQRLRTLDYYDLDTKTRKANPSWQDVYDGIDNTVEMVYLKDIKPGKMAKAREAWKDAAARTEAKGATAAGPVALPKWVLEGMGEVTGNRRLGGSIGSKTVERMSENFFNGPMNYRRGFLAEGVRKSERARLRKLYAAQDLQVIPDAAYMRMLQRRFPAASRDTLATNMGHVQTVMEERFGVISQRYVDELVEHKVIGEMENQLYAFHRSSRAGQKIKGLSPFGAAWGDMWGFWGREAMSRPALRGWLNNENHAVLGDIANTITDYLPFNPKTAAFASRLAATDFDLENVDEDPVFGAIATKLGVEEFDVSPALFLPTGGRNPFMVMIPPLGIVPVGMAHVFFQRTAPDPIEDPQGYQQHLLKWGEFIPGLAYNRPHSLGQMATQSVLGGGLLSRMNKLASNMDQYFNPDEFPDRSAITGDWKQLIQYNRGVQQALSTPEAFQNLITEFSELNPNDVNDVTVDAFVNDLLNGVTIESAKKNALPLIAETVLEAIVPANVEAVDQTQDLAEVWIENGQKGYFPGLDMNRLDLDTEENRQISADIIRTHFFALPDIERDALLVEHPELSVNMVSMWTKSRLGEFHLGNSPYRTGGSDLSQDTHATNIELGYIEPKNPRNFAIEILGVQMQAQQNLATDLYSGVVNSINDERWAKIQALPEVISSVEDVKNLLTEKDLAPWRTTEDVWRNYDKAVDLILRERYEGTEKFDAMSFEEQDIWLDTGKSVLGIPGAFKAWGESLPSDRESLRDDLEFGYQLSADHIDGDALRRASALGIDLEPGMEMVALYQSVANRRAEAYLDNPLFIEVMNEFVAIRTPRSAAKTSFTSVIGTAIDHGEVDPETRRIYKQSTFFIEEAIRMRSRASSNDTSWIEMRDRGVDLLGEMLSDDVMNKLGIPGLFNEAYGRTLGNFDWEPDKPAPLFNGEDLNPEAQRVFVTDVKDGDTLDVTSQPGGTFLGVPEATETIRVRLLGINAREMAEDGGEEDLQRLQAEIESAMEQGLPIYVVRDSKRKSNVDFYGRQFSWLYIGETPYYFPETMIPER